MAIAYTLTKNPPHSLQQPKRAGIVSAKSLGHSSFTTPVDHPWRDYRKKLNEKPAVIAG
ncbi:MAG: hypothetical protein AB2L21_04855 [Anaerolineaceae bacterium]|jgi:hypothetical protein